MNKKGNIPSIRDLRDAIAKEKKNILDTDSRHLRLRIYGDRWELEGGSSPLVGDEDPLVVHAAYFVVDRYSSSYELARNTITSIRGVREVEQVDSTLSAGGP
jgi:hypothetical protein